MCFRVNESGAPWKRQIVWKVVMPSVLQGPKGAVSFTGPYADFYGAAFYRKGKVTSVVVDKAGELGWNPSQTGGNSRVGLYVYPTLKALFAQSLRRDDADPWVAKLRVKPSDFLHQSRCRQIATYRSVEVLEIKRRARPLKRKKR